MTSAFGNSGNGPVDLATHPIDAVRALAGSPLGAKIAELVPRTESIRRAQTAQAPAEGPTLPGLLILTDQRILMLQERHDWSVGVISSLDLRTVTEVRVERLRSSEILHVRAGDRRLTAASRERGFAAPFRDLLIKACSSTSSPDLDHLASTRSDLRIENPNIPLGLGLCTYVGGFESQPTAIESIRTTVYPSGIAAGPIAIPWSTVLDIWVYGPDTAHSQVTVPRVLLLGVFALAVPKSKKQSFLVIETEPGQGVIECHSHTSAELRSFIEPLRRRLRAEQLERDGPTNTTTSHAPDEHARSDLIAQIRQLAELRDDGLITDDEFEAKKSEMLRRI